MKLDIEVTEAEISDAIRRKARLAIAEYTEAEWFRNDEIRKKIKQFWNETVDKIIQEELANSPAVKAKVVKMIEASLQRQVTALMKEKNK
jgi:hypothetical protein